MLHLIHKDSMPEKKVTEQTKYKFKAITPTKGKMYALTITFNQRLLEDDEFDDPTCQVLFTLPKVYKHFKNIGNVVISVELHKSGVIHYHGTLMMRDAIKYGKMLRTFTRTIGHLELRELDGTTTWHEYCLKQGEYMRDVINIPHLYDMNPNHLTYQYITADSYNEANIALKKKFNDRINRVTILEQIGVNQYGYEESGIADPLDHNLDR